MALSLLGDMVADVMREIAQGEDGGTERPMAGPVSG